MSHFDIIIITGTLFISSTVGVYAAIRCINQHTTPSVNALSRRGDIELQYIEPSTNNNLDLVQPQQVYNPNINSCLEDSINLQRTQSYWSDNPPSYNSGDLLQPQQVYISEVIPERVPCTSEATYNTSEGIPSCSSNYTLLQPEQVYIPGTIPSSSMTSYSEDSMNLQRIPSYWNDLNIHCCLENSININYILFNLFYFLNLLKYWLQ